LRRISAEITGESVMARIARILLLCAIAAGLPAQPRPPVAQSVPIGDSLGLQALNVAFDLLPGARLTHRLTRGQLRAARPELTLTALGPTAMGWGIRNRPDHLTIDFGFEWNAGSLDAREITDDAVLDRMDVMWLGKDAEEFTAIAGRVMTALRGASAAPSCLKYPPDDEAADRWRRFREAAWYADGWISTVYLSAVAEPGRKQFVVHYRAFLFRPQFVPYYIPLRASWDCLPDVHFIMAPFTARGR
jgi:hypothetical protein